jgi:hypothetical protein
VGDVRGEAEVSEGVSEVGEEGEDEGGLAVVETGVVKRWNGRVAQNPRQSSWQAEYICERV